MFKETASGASANRTARNQILNLAQARQIDAILVSELSRWGRSTQDLLDTLNSSSSISFLFSFTISFFWQLASSSSYFFR